MDGAAVSIPFFSIPPKAARAERSFANRIFGIFAAVFDARFMSSYAAVLKSVPAVDVHPVETSECSLPAHPMNGRSVTAEYAFFVHPTFITPVRVYSYVLMTC